MKRKVIIILTVVALAAGGAIYGFTYKSTSDCPLAGTKECPGYVNCPKKGQPDCPLIQNCPKKGQPDCPYKNGTASCCEKKTVH